MGVEEECPLPLLTGASPTLEEAAVTLGARPDTLPLLLLLLLEDEVAETDEGALSPAVMGPPTLKSGVHRRAYKRVHGKHD